MISSRNRLIDYNNTCIKKLSPYQISLYQRKYLSQTESEDQTISQNKLNDKKIISLKDVFKTPKTFLSPQKNWPKITKPKLPFSNKYIESREERRSKIRLQKPSKTLHNFPTVKWLRNKYSDSVVEKSVLSLLPEKSNEIQMVYKEDKEKSKRYQKMMDYLNGLKGPFGREKYVEINPKYLYNESTFDKILKLREIFLEFDQRKTQKMDFDEILNMFNQNHIKADKKDIADLFFKGKKIKRKEDIAKLNMGFFQFIKFALKKEQNFKEFMRKIKEKNKKSGDNENAYLPIDFNLIMDYFINKEKQRHSINKLKKTMNILDNDIKINEQEEKINFNKINENRKKTRILSKSLTKRIKNIKKEKKILSDINILDIFDEFIKLFHFISKSEIKRGTSINYSFDRMNTENITNYKRPSALLYNDNNFKNDKVNKTSKNKKGKNDILNILIKNQMNKKSIKDIKIKNYNKYHDVDLAREATIDKIKEDEKYNDNIILEKFNSKK